MKPRQLYDATLHTAGDFVLIVSLPLTGEYYLLMFICLTKKVRSERMKLLSN